MKKFLIIPLIVFLTLVVFTNCEDSKISSSDNSSPFIITVPEEKTIAPKEYTIDVNSQDKKAVSPIATTSILIISTISTTAKEVQMPEEIKVDLQFNRTILYSHPPSAYDRSPEATQRWENWGSNLTCKIIFSDGRELNGNNAGVIFIVLPDSNPIHKIRFPCGGPQSFKDNTISTPENSLTYFAEEWGVQKDVPVLWKVTGRMTDKNHEDVTFTGEVYLTLR